MLTTRGILYKNGERYLRVREARQYEVHHFAAPSLKIPALASPPPVAITSARHNYRAEGMATGGGEAPVPLGAGADVRKHAKINHCFTH